MDFEILENRNRNLGAMFASELANDYLSILFILLDFRRDYEFEVLRDILLNECIKNIGKSCKGEIYDNSQFDQEINQLLEWGIISRRVEKNRIRSYKDVSRDRFRFSLTDESVAFLIWLEERRANDLLPHDDDSINLLEFILGATKQLTRALKNIEENFSSVIFSLGDILEKTSKLNQNLNNITILLSDFLLRVYTPEEAKEIVDGVDQYFKNYLLKLQKLRSSILVELEKLLLKDNIENITKCINLFVAEQQKIPRLMRSSNKLNNPIEQLEVLYSYYKRGGKIDKLCGSVNDNAMKVFGKLISYLKELERRSNRLEFINNRLLELATKEESFEAPNFIRKLICSAAAPLDMNYSDEFQKAEPIQPRSSTSSKKLPPKVFKRTVALNSQRTETHEEMRLRILSEFMKNRYPQNGNLGAEFLEKDEILQIAQLLKYGLLGNGKKLEEINKFIELDKDNQEIIYGADGSLTGPITTIKELK